MASAMQPGDTAGAVCVVERVTCSLPEGDSAVSDAGRVVTACGIGGAIGIRGTTSAPPNKKAHAADGMGL